MSLPRVNIQANALLHSHFLFSHFCLSFLTEMGENIRRTTQRRGKVLFITKVG